VFNFLLGIILVQFADEVFSRTLLGNNEIRERKLSLSNDEKIILASIVGEVKFQDLQREFEIDTSVDFLGAIETLLKKDLICHKPRVAISQSFPAIDIHAERFGSEEFFSSSMDPLNSGSGLVVDTKTNSMRSVNLKKKPESVYDVDIPLSLELDTNLRLKKSKRSSKLGQVYPEPEKRRKRRKSNRSAAPMESPWRARIYGGLVVFGVLLMAFALWMNL
jgi:hypothetical protein